MSVPSSLDEIEHDAAPIVWKGANELGITMAAELSLSSVLFRALLRSSRASVQAPSLWKALSNGTAEISPDVIAIADLQTAAARLHNRDMLRGVFVWRFRRGEPGAYDEAFDFLRKFNNVSRRPGNSEHAIRVP